MLALSFAPLLMVTNIMLMGIGWWALIVIPGLFIVGWTLRTFGWILPKFPTEKEVFGREDIERLPASEPDKAQLVFNRGGIDLAQMNVAAGKSGEGIAMNFDPVLLEKLRSAKTFRPVIFSIRPAGVNILQNSWGIPAQVTKP